MLGPLPRINTGGESCRDSHGRVVELLVISFSKMLENCEVQNTQSVAPPMPPVYTELQSLQTAELQKIYCRIAENKLDIKIVEDMCCAYM